MLVLSSNGLSSISLMNEIQKHFTSATKKAVIITTASVGYGEKDRKLPRLTEELKSLNLTVAYFDIEIQNPKLLRDFDVIEIMGGNPFYLLQQMKRNDCTQIFQQLSKEKIIIGISAGSVVLQNTIQLIAQYSPELNENIGISDLSGLALTDAEILPHYSRFLTCFERFEERARQYEIDNQCAVTRMNDGQALFITDQRKYVV